MSQKSRLDTFLEKGTAEDAANCLIALCMKINAMLTSMLTAQLRGFKNQGGFAENLSRTRLAERVNQATEANAPACPKCGKPMLKRSVRRGTKLGKEFWGCSDYPNCNGTRNN